MARLGHYLRFESVLPPALRELVILTIAREVDSQVEWTAHEPLARQAGVRAEAIVAVRDRHAPAGLTEKEALMVCYGQELVRQHQVSTATFQAALQRLGAQGIIDLTVTVGYYALTGLVTNALDIQLGAGRQPLLPV
jgi:4-carboxymuconolactone decarboxylase